MDNSKANRLTAAFAPTPDCFEIDELSLLLDGKRGEQLQRRAETHLAGCLHCQNEIALLREFESPAVRAGEQNDVNWIVSRLRKNSPAAPLPWWKQIGSIRILVPASLALATALIATGIGLQMRQTPYSPVSAPGREVMRSQSVDILSPLGDLTAAPTMMKWRAVAGASRYRVRLLEVDRTELWKTTVSQTSVALDESVRQKIAPLKSLLWDVTALNDTGTALASSGLQRFRLKTGPAR